MADNIDVDPGTGASKLPVATDDCGAAGHIQRVKLDIGGNGVSSPFIDPATETTLASALTSLQTIDNAISGAGVNISQIGGSAARTADLNLDVGTDTYPAISLAFASLTGGLVVSSTNPLPISAIGNVSFTTGWVTGDGASDTGDNVIVPAYVRDDALATLTVTDGQYTQGRVDSTGALWTHLAAGTASIGILGANSGVDIGDVTINNAAGASAVNIQDGGNSITVDGTVAVSGTVDTELPTAAALTDNFANPTAPGVGAFGMVWDGVTWDRAAGTSADGALVNLGTNNDVTVTGTVTANLAAGTNNIGDVDVLTVPAPLSTTGGGTEATALRVTLANDSTGLVSIDDNGGSLTIDQATASNLNAQVVGAIAHDAVDSGNPLKIGGKARQTNPTAVADADRVDATFDDIGRQVVVVGQVRDLMTHQHTQIASSSAETTILTAVASTFLDLTQLVITNQTATAVNVTIKDATAGTTRMIIALAASGGAVIPFNRPVTQAAVNNNWTATLSSAAVTVNIFAQAEKNV